MSSVSFFTITTNPLKWEYPVVESIQSVLPYANEVVIVDGGSTDGTIETLQALSPKIRIINNEQTKWEEDWVYWRMGKNLATAFDACQGDWAFKFDTDYIFGEDYDIKNELRFAETREVLTLGLDRYNFILSDRYYRKSVKTLAVNKRLCEEKNLNVKWGYDIPHFGLGDDAIIFKEFKDNINQGNLLSHANSGRNLVSGLEVFNYGYTLRNKKKSQEVWHRNMTAFYRQQKGIKYQPKEFNGYWRDYEGSIRKALNNLPQERIPLKAHPSCIRSKIESLTPNQQGFNAWGLTKYQSNYYGQP